MRAAAAAALAAALIALPLYASSFFLVQIGIQSLFLGILALSIVFLAGCGGMLSLAQTSLYGLAGYTVAVLTVRHGLAWWAAVPAALAVATAAASVLGLVAVRTQGLYFLMITLAMAMAIYAFAQENQSLLGGHTGINGVRPPLLAGLSFRQPWAFYELALGVAALAYGGVRYLLRTPFGLALQGVRDDARRLAALGFWVQAHRVAAFALAGLLAALAGVLGVWYNGAISPEYINLTQIIDGLIIAVVGGIAYPEGAFLGALVFTLVTNFASSYTDRYNTVIGLSFLLILLFSPDGLIGLGGRLARRRGAAGGAPRDAHR